MQITIWGVRSPLFFSLRGFKMHVTKKIVPDGYVLAGETFETFSFYATSEMGTREYTAVYAGNEIIVRCMSHYEKRAIKRMEKRLLHIASDLKQTQVNTLAIEVF